MKHDPSAAETLDSVTQGASLFLDPTGAQVGEQVQGEEGIAYADLDLNECIEPKQFHDVVGGYQRYDVFDMRISQKRLGPEKAFDQIERPAGTQKNDGPVDVSSSSEEPTPARPSANLKHGVGGLRMM